MDLVRGVRVPASTSNLGPGFDALGCALDLYLDVRVEPAQNGFRVQASGVDSHKVPGDQDNLILRALLRVASRRGRTIEPLTLVADNEIPLASGLGSSAAAVLAGISCYEVVSGDRLTPDEIMDYAWEFEPHPDNLAAALFGGLTIPVTTGGPKAGFLKLEVSGGLTPVVVTPDLEVPTRRAREVLPDSYSRSDVVFNIQRTAQLVGALVTGQWAFLAEAMKDRIHQPYRASLIPGLEQVLSLKAEGLYGLALSGAGPTVLILADPVRAEEIGARVADVFRTHGLSSRVRISKIDTDGRRFLEAGSGVSV